jgi:hypothetical protein
MMIAEDVKSVDVRREVMDAYNAHLQQRMKHTAWNSGCKSWYLNPDGSNHALYPGFASEYCLGVRQFKPAEYQVVPQAAVAAA